MRVLIVSGAHKGEVHEVRDGQRSLEIVNPSPSRAPVFTMHNEPSPEPMWTTEVYRLGWARLRYPHQPDQAIDQLVGQSMSDYDDPTIALVRYTLNRALHNPTNP